MKKVLKSKHNTLTSKKFLIPKHPDIEDKEWIEISIDLKAQTFIAIKKIQDHIGEEWEDYKDFTFPSSLFNDFLFGRI